MDKKYQIFVSSTYTDLIEERQEVFKTLIDLGHIPVGMESFPAIDMEQFEYIKQMIDTCDYYILIIAGRYGSCADDGISYTEKEYDYAKLKNIPVICLQHINYRELPHNKVENTDDGKSKLDAFIQKASTSKVRKEYGDKNSLRAEIALSLPHTIKIFPAIGWVRANQTANTQTLIDHINLKNENEALKVKLSEYENTKIQIDNLADFDDVFEFEFKLRNGRDILKDTKTWREIFLMIAGRLRGGCYKSSIANYLEIKKDYIVIDNDLNKILAQFEILSLIQFSTQSGRSLYTLTSKGEQIMLQSLAVTKNQEAFVVEL